MPELTKHQLVCLQLAAEGLTNRQIADRLWVVEKTVTFHLGRAYKTLGVTCRAEAIAMLNGGRTC